VSLCDCCDLPVGSCGKAAERRQRKELAEFHKTLSARGWFPAEYPGVCSCGEPFNAGALIVRDTGSGRWIAECCADKPRHGTLYGRVR